MFRISLRFEGLGGVETITNTIWAEDSPVLPQVPSMNISMNISISRDDVVSLSVLYSVDP